MPTLDFTTGDEKLVARRPAHALKTEEAWILELVSMDWENTKVERSWQGLYTNFFTNWSLDEMHFKKVARKMKKEDV